MGYRTQRKLSADENIAMGDEIVTQEWRYL